MIELEALRPGTVVRKLAALSRTEDAPDFVVEVEDFVFGVGPAEIFRSGHGQVLLVLENAAPIGVAIHRPHEKFNAELMAAVVLSPEHRGKGLAESMLRAVVAEAHRASGRSSVLWLVHEDNGVMRKVSARVAGQPDYQTDDGYALFIHDA